MKRRERNIGEECGSSFRRPTERFRLDDGMDRGRTGTWTGLGTGQSRLPGILSLPSSATRTGHCRI